MGASFRNMGEIIELAGSDLLTISPNLLAELAAAEGTLELKLDAAKAKGMAIEPILVDKDVFEFMHEGDRMANDKLKEGIEGFTAALVKLEALLSVRLAMLELRMPAATQA